jgi:hypothetical protein
MRCARADEGIRGYAVHPRVVFGTNLAPWITDDELRAMGVIDDSGRPIIAPDRELKSPQQAASTSVFAATSLCSPTSAVSISRTTTSHRLMMHRRPSSLVPSR